tara:strand:- start:470 stop:1066 length:597 start_codon:yes stop_codon:yes gene_type:complete
MLQKDLLKKTYSLLPHLGPCLDGELDLNKRGMKLIDKFQSELEEGDFNLLCHFVLRTKYSTVRDADDLLGGPKEEQLEKQLGPNAQSFAEHIQTGIEWAGLEMSDFKPMVVTHKEDGRLGFAICQLDVNVEPEAAIDSMVCCFEDSLEWMLPEITTSMCINEENPSSQIATIILGRILTGEPLHAPSCPCCEAEKEQV